MELSPGTRLLHYRLVEPIGEGGMGAVWRASDEKLGRDVALKVLPEAFVEDAQRRVRFEREAKLLASLNHPNIATLHCLEQVDDRHVLVMELVEGEELSERTKRGPVAVDEALPIALQIAEGLEAAHERGIIHRDLKPANVMIGVDGTVKVLDFGLATAWEPGTVDGDLTRSPTVTAQMTQAGVILGTAAYMSPEQARGLPLDKRTDIWAFGVVLYEMLSGASCFGGDTLTDILAAIVKEAPDWSRLSEPLPRRVLELLERLLEKDPNRRLRDIGEARLSIESAIGGAGEPLPDFGEVQSVARGMGRRSWMWLAAGLVVGAVAGASLLGWLAGRTPLDKTPVTHLQVALPEGQMLAFGSRVPNTIGISPDGRTIAVVVADRGSLVDYNNESSVDTRLWLRSLDALQGHFVPGSDGAMQPFFSPDGRRVGFFARGKLRKALVAGGGAVETVCDADDPWGGSWPEHDLIIFASSRAEGLVTQRVPAVGGTPEMLAELEISAGEQEQNYPSLLPGGRSILYMAWHAGETSSARTLVYDLESGRRTTLVEGGLRPEFHSPHLLYNVGPTLFGVPMTVDPPALNGASVEIFDNLLVDPDYESGQWAASAAGTLVYATGGRPQTDQRIVWVSLDGSIEGILESGKTIRTARIAGDTRIVFSTIDVNTDIYAHDLRRGTTSRLTIDPVWDGTPAPSRNGDRIAFSSYRSGSEDLFIVEPDGSIVQLLEADGTRWPTSWSRDDRWLAYTERNPATLTDIWMIPMDEEGAEPVRLAATAATEGGAAFSPVADYLAYMSDESGNTEVWLRSYPASSGRGATLVSSGGGTGPLWARDGRRLYYHTPQGLMAVDVELGPKVRLGQPRQVLSDPTLRVMGVAADGRLLAIKSEAMPEVTTLNIILGFDRLLDIAR